MATVFKGFPRRPAAGDEIHIAATDARQANWGRHALWMLICSTALVVIALFGAWAFKAGDLADANAISTPTAAEVQAAGEPVR